MEENEEGQNQIKNGNKREKIDTKIIIITIIIEIIKSTILIDK